MTDYLAPQFDLKSVNAQSMLTLAHIGDGVYELMVRTRLAAEHTYTSGAIHRAVLRHVSATAQAAAFEKIRALLTEDETAVFTRGRNAHSRVPKSATGADYHTSTGMEALFGYLWLAGKRERLNELFRISMGAD